nr:Maf family protein [uncultured Lachnoclostridium sp.]
MYQCILASGSPRRKEILEQCGITFRIEKSDTEEVITKTRPSDVVMELSEVKALEAAGRVKETECIIIGADTIVANGEVILGKPKDEAEACAMIESLQGHEHSVYTGVTLVIRRGGKQEIITLFEETKVEIISMNEDEIKEYVKSGEPMDKAGAYAIQGLFAGYVKGIRGDYYNVVGLPICAILEELRKAGIDLKKDCKN